MKKTLFIFILSLLIIPNGTFAQNAGCASSADCSSGQFCDLTKNPDPDSTAGTCVSGTAPTNPGDDPNYVPAGAPSSPGSSGPQSFKPLVPIPGLTDAGSGDLATFFNNLYKYLIGIAAVLAVIQIIRGGLEISTESVFKKADGKRHIMEALFGLLLVLSPVVVFSIINPSILNLSVSLPGLNTKSSWLGSGGGSNSGPSTDTTTGCSVTGLTGLLQVAICPSEEAAVAWGNSNACIGDAVSSPKKVTTGANGTGTYGITCAATRRFMFVDVSKTALTSFGTYRPHYVPNKLRPLARTSVDQKNGYYAQKFVDICKGGGLGWQTCVDDDPTYTMSDPCSPPYTTQFPPDVSGKCYSERLSCEPSGYILTANAPYCVESPDWTPVE